MVFSFCSGVNRTVGEAHSYGWRIHVRRSGRALLGHLRLWSFPKNSAVHLAAAAWWEEASESAD
jgi:hypothetical protein